MFSEVFEISINKRRFSNAELVDINYSLNQKECKFLENSLKKCDNIIRVTILFCDKEYKRLKFISDEKMSFYLRKSSIVLDLIILVQQVIKRKRIIHGLEKFIQNHSFFDVIPLFNEEKTQIQSGKLFVKDLSSKVLVYDAEHLGTLIKQFYTGEIENEVLKKATSGLYSLIDTKSLFKEDVETLERIFLANEVMINGDGFEFLLKNIRFNQNIRKTKHFELFIRIMKSYELFNKLIVNTSCVQFWSGSILQLSCLIGATNAVKYLIKNGADCFLRYGKKPNPIQICCEENQLEILKYFVSQGIKISYRDKKNGGNTTIHVAVQNNALEIVKFCIEEMVKESGKYSPQIDDNGNTPLHIACENCKIKIVKLLHKYGGDANISNNKGESSFSKIFSSGSTYSKKRDLILYFLNESNKLDVEKVVLGNLPLNIACENGDYETVELLIKKYDVNIDKSNDNGEVPIHSVVEGEFEPEENGIKIIELFLKKNPQIFKKRNARKKTPLFLSIKNKRNKLSKFLFNLEFGENIETFSKEEKNSFNDFLDARSNNVCLNQNIFIEVIFNYFNNSDVLNVLKLIGFEKD